LVLEPDTTPLVGDGEPPLLFTVTDLKQFDYCGRVLFYERCLPHVRPRTYKMDAGRAEHEDEQKRAVRRNLSKYEIGPGERRFNVAITVPALRLTGLIDEVVYSVAGGIFPVDYKLTQKVGHNHKIQLTAYALLLEAHHHQPVERGFLYLIPTRQTVEIAITPRLRLGLRNLVEQMATMVLTEQMPPPTTNRSRCVACEFRRFCNDV
jgi:CRISPR-associated exonuclease Cas4